MTPKIEKLAREIDKSRTRIIELQSRINELEQQKTELENTEIVALFRSLDVPSERLPRLYRLGEGNPGATRNAIGSCTTGFSRAICAYISAGQ